MLNGRPAGGVRPSHRLPWRLGRAGVVALVCVAVLVWLVAWNYPHFDSYVHLTWARDTLNGLTPGFASSVAPTEHPLWLLTSVVLVLAFGSQADHAMIFLMMLSW